MSSPTPALDLSGDSLRANLAEILPTLSDQDCAIALYEWQLWARPDQVPPAGDWRVWMLLGGRGSGKTRSGAEWVRARAAANPNARIALVARTSADVRDVIVEGESGILAISPPWDRPTYIPSKRRLEWGNGAIATTYTADEPDTLRGPQHTDAWADELAAWRFPDTWDQLLMGLRLGDDPRVVVTTTPRPTPLIRRLRDDPTCSLARSRTLDNAANLAPAFLSQIVTRYQGTRIGRQELEGELLDDLPGALWKRDAIDETRVSEAPAFKRVVVAIDPAVTATEDSDQTGIVVAGLAHNGHAYIIEDCSVRETVDGWARRAVAAYRRHSADRVIAEVNNGGDLVERVIRTVDRSIPYRAVRATRGKSLRAEPIAALYEQGRVHHVGSWPELEDQLCALTQDGYTGEGSPDRADAAVWALTELMVDTCATWSDLYRPVAA